MQTYNGILELCSLDLCHISQSINQFIGCVKVNNKSIMSVT